MTGAPKDLDRKIKILISRERQDSDTSPTTFTVILFVKLMLNTFWSFIRNVIANERYVKEGHNKNRNSFWKVWLLSTLSLKLFQFPIFGSMDVLNLGLYPVSLFQSFFIITLIYYMILQL